MATGELWVSARYESFEDPFEPFVAGTGHSGACHASFEAGGRQRLRDDVRRRLGRPGGGFTLSARAWWTRGVVDGAR